MAGSKKKRYTDKELERFKKLIVQKIDQAKQDLDLLKSCLLYTSPSPRD